MTANCRRLGKTCKPPERLASRERKPRNSSSSEPRPNKPDAKDEWPDEGAREQWTMLLVRGSAVTVRGEHRWVLIHRCTRCGRLRMNRTAADDNALLLLQLAALPLAMPPILYLSPVTSPDHGIKDAGPPGSSRSRTRSRIWTRVRHVLCGTIARHVSRVSARPWTGVPSPQHLPSQRSQLCWQASYSQERSSCVRSRRRDTTCGSAAPKACGRRNS
jgi:hypothetical protein